MGETRRQRGKRVGSEAACQGERDPKVCQVLMVSNLNFLGILVINPLFLRRPGLSSLFKKKTHHSRKRAINILAMLLART